MKSVLNTLHEAGYQAWLAGGCVRDGILGVSPKDFDVATNALPEQVQGLFEKSVDVGKAFGVIVIPFKECQVEVATFRSDGDYLDGRHPEDVNYSSPEEDAQRRDFTVNALFFDIFENEIHDFVGGVADIEAQIIRAVGNPLKRFQEDQLRLLRGIRFSAQLGFSIEDSTWEAIKCFINPLKNVSRERVCDEMEKLLGCRKALLGLEALTETYLMEDIFGELSSQITLGNAWSVFGKINEQNAPMEFRWALLFLDTWSISPSKVREWVMAQPFSRKQRMDILSILKLCGDYFSGEFIEKILIDLDRSLLSVWFFDFLLVIQDVLDGNPSASVEELQKKYRNNLNSKGFLVEPLVNGGDLLRLGIEKGPLMGALLEKIYLLQIRDQVRDKDLLLNHPTIVAYTSKEV